MKNCPNCGHENLEDARFARNAGIRLRQKALKHRKFSLKKNSNHNRKMTASVQTVANQFRKTLIFVRIAGND